jgi:hypothetical protein
MNNLTIFTLFFPFFGSNTQYFEEAEKTPQRSRAGRRRTKVRGKTEGDPPGEPLFFHPPGPPENYQALFLLYLSKLRITEVQSLRGKAEKPGRGMPPKSVSREPPAA